MVSHSGCFNETARFTVNMFSFFATSQITRGFGLFFYYFCILFLLTEQTPVQLPPTAKETLDHNRMHGLIIAETVLIELDKLASWMYRWNLINNFEVTFYWEENITSRFQIYICLNLRSQIYGLNIILMVFGVIFLSAFYVQCNWNGKFSTSVFLALFLIFCGVFN